MKIIMAVMIVVYCPSPVGLIRLEVYCFIESIFEGVWLRQRDHKGSLPRVCIQPGVSESTIYLPSFPTMLVFGEFCQLG